MLLNTQGLTDRILFGPDAAFSDIEIHRRANHPAETQELPNNHWPQGVTSEPQFSTIGHLTTHEPTTEDNHAEIPTNGNVDVPSSTSQTEASPHSNRQPPDFQRLETSTTDTTLDIDALSNIKSDAESPTSIANLPAPGRRIRQPHPAVALWKKVWHREPHTWNPRLLQLRPLVGIVATCVVIACVFASLAVLNISNCQATSTWSFSPSTALAIITAVANSAVALAYMEAVPISWWYSTTRGRSIRALERHWQVTRSAILAMAHLQRLSILNLACIATAFVVIDGPLLQKASTVVRGTQTNPVTLEVQLLPELPNGFSGSVTDGLIYSDPRVMTIGFHQTRDDPIVLDVSGCPLGECYTTLRAPAVAKSNCSSRTWNITPQMLKSLNSTWVTDTDRYGVPRTTLSAFFVDLNVAYDLPASSAAELQVGLARWDDLRGEYVLTTCYLVPAIAEYDVIIKDRTVALDGDFEQGRIISLANNTKSIITTPSSIRETQLSTLDALTVETSLIVDSNASVSLDDPGNTGRHYATNSATSFNPFVLKHYVYPVDYLDLRWVDPTADVIYTMNKMMFRGGVIAADWNNQTSLLDPGINKHQTVAASQKITQNIYQSDLRWWAGAAVTQIVTVLLILPMFWGWWRLECSLNLSPCAIALAFDSPILQDANSASRPREIVDQLGAVRLKYGIVAEPGTDGYPKENTTFASGRLGIGEVKSVVKPRKETVFLR